MTHPRRCRMGDSGFTLVELLATIAIATILLTMAVGGWLAYQRAHAEADTARQVTGVLREAQVRAEAEDATYRVDFASTPTTSYSLYKYNGNGWSLVSNYTTADSNVKLTSASFTSISGDPDEPNTTSCYFFGRGTATKGSVTVTRSGTSKTYTINVEGFTGRVQYDNS